jgi:hypothetical protein
MPDVLDGDLTAMYLPYREHLEYALNQLRTRNAQLIKDLYVDLVDDCQFNALAFTAGGSEFVGINAGIAVTLPLYYLDIFARSEAFPEIGNASGEKPSDLPIDPRLISVSGPARSWKPGTNWRPIVETPKDPLRMKSAQFMAMIAWDFILFHEIGHITRCHLPFLASAGFCDTDASDVRTLVEFHSKMSARERKLRRTLEVDADVSSARAQVAGYVQNEPKQLAEFYGGAAGTWEDFCYHWQVAVHLLFQVMAMQDTEAIDHVDRTHPHADLRMYMLVNLVHEIWARVIPDQATYTSIVMRAKHDVEELMRLQIIWSSTARSADSYSKGFKAGVKELQNGIADTNRKLYALGNERMSK